MAMETISAHAITQFSDMMHVRAQQIRARLRPYVEIRRLDGELFAYDGLGTVEAREIVGTRYPQTVFDDIEHNRRKLSKREFVITLPISDSDLENRLTDPQGQYADACVMAMERMFDRVVYDAMFADVATGREFATTVTAASDGVRTVAMGAAVTLAKLLELRQNFMDDEVGNDIPVDLCMGITGDEHTTMLQIATLTSRDYSEQFALEKGEITRAVGIDLIKFGANATNPVLAVSGGSRTGFCMAKNAICVGVQREWKITVKDRPDLVNTKQLQITGVLGAVRTEGKLIQKYTVNDL